MDTDLRIKIAKQTLEILTAGHYINNIHQQVSIKDALDFAVRNSILYRPNEFESLQIKAEQLIQNRDYQTLIEITNESTIAAAIRLSNERNTACLNFASAKNPGGGFLGGAQAQEESIARASGLYPCINQMHEMYSFNKKIKTCLYSDYTIFSKEVPVIRDENDHLLNTPCKVSIITSPAVNTGLVKQREPDNIAIIEETMKRRLSMILNIALVNNVETLILGAWGCGVFQNDPEQIAQLFAEQLLSKYKNSFRRIVFAILDNPKKSTFTQFTKVFHFIQ